MKAIAALRRKGLSFGSGTGTFVQPPWWQHEGDLLALGPAMSSEERIPDDFDSHIAAGFKSNGVVFTTILIRQAILSEARFRFRRMEQGRPGDLWGDARLELLESPWEHGTTGELIARMEQDGSLAGNFFAADDRSNGRRRLRRLRPDWVTIVTVSPDRSDGSPGKPWDLGSRVGGYLYTPQGDVGAATLLTPDEVVHYAPIPDPAAQWRGMSWITAVSREISGDTAATRHKLKFFDNGATSNFVVTYDKDVAPAKVRAAATMFNEQYSGTDKAYRAIHLGGGADVKVAGANMQQLDFKVTQGAGESRIAAASLVGAVMAQLSEGLAGSSLNAGNFNAAKRRFADVGARPLWRAMASSLAKVIDVPDDSQLWYEDRDIPFLQDDADQRAKILTQQAQAIRTLSDGGFDPGSVVDAVMADDLRLLTHTGLLPVQVQQPGEAAGDPPTPASDSGS